MTLRRMLTDGSRDLGVLLSEDQANAFLVYLVELDKWNQKINLTAIRNEQEIVVKHFLDSLSYLSGFTPSPGRRLLDMGSGAGFPALPIKIVRPEVSVTLVESVKKKASFLRHIIRTLKLTGAEVADVRTEELPETYRSAYDIVTARAFADIRSAIQAGMPFLKPEGLMVLSRGAGETVGKPELDKLGVLLEKRMELMLPFSDHKRAIWVFKREG